jgi:hypothetical protein
MNGFYGILSDMIEALNNSQADALYTASIKTFWPGYETHEGDTDDESNNRLAKIDKDFQPDYASVADQRAEVRRIQRSEYAKTHWPKFYSGPAVLVKSTNKRYDAWTSGESNWELGAVRDVTLNLPKGAWGRSRAVLLHELAHAVERYEHAHEPPSAREYFDDGHGARYARVNIDMVREFYSPEMGDKLEANFRAGGVKIA